MKNALSHLCGAVLEAAATVVIIFGGYLALTASPGPVNSAEVVPYSPPTACVDKNPWYGTTPTTVADSNPYVTVDPQLYKCTHYPAPTTTLPVNPDLTAVPPTTAAPVSPSTATTPESAAIAPPETPAVVQVAQASQGQPIATVSLPPGSVFGATGESCAGTLATGSWSTNCTNAGLSGVCPSSGDISSQQSVEYFGSPSASSSFQNDFCGLAQSGYRYCEPKLTFPGEPVQTGLDPTKCVGS